MKSRREFLKEAATGAVVAGFVRRSGRAGTGRYAGAACEARQVKSGDCARSCAARPETQSQTRSGCSICSTAPLQPTRAATIRWRRGSTLWPGRRPGQGDRAQDERAGRQGNFDSPGAGAGDCRAVAAGGREAGQHSGVGPERARSRGVRPDHQHRSKPHPLLSARMCRASRSSRSRGERRSVRFQRF